MSNNRKASIRSRSTPRERTSSPFNLSGPPPVQRSTLKSARPAVPTQSSSPFTDSLRPGSASSRPSSSGSMRPGSSGGRLGYDDLFTSCGDSKCICEICNCGKHQCPKKFIKSSVPFDGQTTSGCTYKGHDPVHFAERATAPKTLFSGMKVPSSHFMTTHNSHYVSHDVDQYLQPHDEKMQKATKPVRQAPREKFEHTSSNRSDYPWHGTDALSPGQAARSPSPSLHQTSLGSPSGEMNLLTSYSTHFVGHSGRPPSPVRKPSSDYAYGSPRDFGTTNRMHFSGVQNSRCPAQVLPARPASSGSGHVRYRLDMSGTWV